MPAPVVLNAPEALDRLAADVADPGRAARPRTLAFAVLAAGALAGALIGSYALDAPVRLLGVVYSAAKVPLLILASAAITLPGFFVINTVLRLRDDWPGVLRAILRGQAALCLALAGLSPITVLAYASGLPYRWALLWNAGVFTLATLTAQAVMRRAYAPLIAGNPRHRPMLALWTVLYAFVGIQMGWTLRPFLGAPGATPTFLRDEPLSNAYTVILRLLAP